MIEEMQAVQAKIAGILDHETRSAGVDIIYGRAGRLDGKTVWLDEERIVPDAVIVATGSRSNIPPVAGITLPGVFIPRPCRADEETAGAYRHPRWGGHGRGVCLHLLPVREPGDRHLPEHIPENSRPDTPGRGDPGTFRGNDPRTYRPPGNHRRGQRVSVTVKTGDAAQEIPCDAVFVAAGLVPRSDMISGVKKGPIGEVIVNEYMETSVPGVYAGGDVTGPPYLTPVARHQGIVAADNILGKAARNGYPVDPAGHISLKTSSASPLTGAGRQSRSPSPGPAGPDTFWSVPSSGYRPCEDPRGGRWVDQRDCLCFARRGPDRRLHGVPDEAPLLGP